MAGGAVQLVNIRIRGDHGNFCLQANAAAQNSGAVPGVCAGLDEPNLHVVFFVIVLGDQRLGGFAGAHGTVFEIKLRHFVSPFFQSYHCTKETSIMQALSGHFTQTGFSSCSLSHCHGDGL